MSGARRPFVLMTEILLQQYRRRDPGDADETEFMDNLFDSLCSALNEPSIKSLFLSAEGPDLMVLMMKWVRNFIMRCILAHWHYYGREKLQCRSRSIKVLDYAMSGAAGSPVCESFIEALGLKTLFSALMGKVKARSASVKYTSSSYFI